MAKAADAEDGTGGALSRAAIAVKARTEAYALDIDDPETLALAESGRWTERLIPVRDGTSFIVVASFYGHSGSSWDPALARTNDRLIKAAVLRAAQFLTTPYFLCCDVNQDPETSLTLCTATETGILVDLAADWAEDKTALEPTFRKEGVYPRMSGPGTSRIDVVYANAVGSAAVIGVETVWEKAILFDHTPIRVRLSVKAMTQMVQRQGRPIGIDLEKCAHRITAKNPEERNKQKKDAATSFGTIWNIIGPEYGKALDSELIDEAHQLVPSGGIVAVPTARAG